MPAGGYEPVDAAGTPVCNPAGGLVGDPVLDPEGAGWGTAGQAA